MHQSYTMCMDIVHNSCFLHIRVIGGGFPNRAPILTCDMFVCVFRGEGGSLTTLKPRRNMTHTSLII